ncbi:hypothetical protein I545_3738 [Mycobacterium kansasii 662]|uniref:Uncharacterized protein n=2 Tax=Mycobacterium kansasii TaxID=1768 RepID=A0A653F2B5_MYCKA|nr:hypothetical protein I545_3738 [Mycobacterium kansasii 662]VAZ60721.1 hypothetical protein LAUMK22_02530 [Mycobacterium kansasii]VAZ67043.1 hypothetical protein LAUMK40_03182 [Mycobacterium kansasii]VAZ76010.1 hypothetical protein LAUMK7_03139 [Mycobacterium kansasii]VTP03763.1 hypothetical protein BIN_B_04059 [Mycobacterium kansasii]
MNSELVDPQLTGGDASVSSPTVPRARLKSWATTFATAGGTGR